MNNPDPAKFQTGDWAAMERQLLNKGLMVCDAPTLVKARNLCLRCVRDLTHVVMRGRWAGMESADLHFEVCDRCGAWMLFAVVPSDHFRSGRRA